MNMKKTDKLYQYLNICIKLKLFFFTYLLQFFLSCNSTGSGNNCGDCGGGEIDGFQYKVVTLTDIGGLVEIDLNVNIEDCIRYKKDGQEYLVATIENDCCCTLYE